MAKLHGDRPRELGDFVAKGINNTADSGFLSVHFVGLSEINGLLKRCYNLNFALNKYQLPK